MKIMEEKEGFPEILFSDFFRVNKRYLKEYGAFNISLVSDLPLFIDPFLIFNSKRDDYQNLHQSIVKYLTFIKEKSVNKNINRGSLLSWYRFKEVKQNWLGYSSEGNKGHALGNKFAQSLNNNFILVFNDFDCRENEVGVRGIHLEKLCLIGEGIGKDNISDFTTNLIKDYLLKYTESFARKYLDKGFCRIFRIPRAKFNFQTETWEEGPYFLPNYKEDFVILTPEDMLAKDDIWINHADLINNFRFIPPSISNEQLRNEINNYFQKVLDVKVTKNGKKIITEKSEREAAKKTVERFPIIIDYYIKYKEDNGERAVEVSKRRVEESEYLYTNNFTDLISLLYKETRFYKIATNSYIDALQRAEYLKNVIENNGGYRFFYNKNGAPIERESDLEILYRLTYCNSRFDFNSQVNNGRGPVDAKTSMGASDATIAELKLASNTHLEKNLKRQIPIYQKASKASKSVIIILYFSEREQKRVEEILKRLGLLNEESIISIDARKDNKPSASTA